MSNPWNAAYDAKPTDPRCDREVEVSFVGDRCVYLNNYRIAGGKPYHSENLPYRAKMTTVREALSAFSEADIVAYLNERRERQAFYAGARAYRDALEAEAPLATPNTPDMEKVKP